MKHNENRKKAIYNGSNKTIAEWNEFFNIYFNDYQINKLKLLYNWYLGDSNILAQSYLEASKMQFYNSVSENRNYKNYFWTIASQEGDIKKTHSGLPKAIIKTLINILDYPTIKGMKDITNDKGLIDKKEDKSLTERIEHILSDNNFKELIIQQQEPMMWVMGQGCFTINLKPEISDTPIIEYIDGRNVAIVRESNRVTKVYTRTYFNNEKNTSNYMLLEERGVDLIEGERTAYIKSTLFRLTSKKTRAIAGECDLKEIKATRNIKPYIAIKGIDKVLAVPCVLNYEPIQDRGISLFNEKMDLFDDLDQAMSQGANCVRLSTPVESIDVDCLEEDENGQKHLPKRYDRRFISVKNSINSVGVNNISPINSDVPQIDFSKYSNEALNIVNNILTGLISPSTLGIGISRVDNALAQREKEKQTMFTRDNLSKLESTIISNVIELALKMEDIQQGGNAGNYEIIVKYNDYASPTFNEKLSLLTPAFANKTMSPKMFLERLYGEDLTEDEYKQELEYLESQVNPMAMGSDPMAYLNEMQEQEEDLNNGEEV